MNNLATTVRDVLADHGIDASVVAGSRRSGRVRLMEPGDARKARRVLTASRLRVAAINSTGGMSVTADDDDEESGEDFGELVASWKQFIARSGDSGFRKASRLRGAMRFGLRNADIIETGRQIVASSWRMSRSSPSLREFSRLLRAAVRRAHRSGDSTPILRVMRKLSSVGQPATVVEDPNRQPKKTERETLKVASRRGRARRHRQAGMVRDLMDSAERYLTDLARERSWSPQDVTNVGRLAGDEYADWRATVSQDVDDDDATTVWASAADTVGHTLASSGGRGAGRIRRSDGQDRQRVFGRQAGGMVVAHTRRQLVRTVELLIEHYAARKHPEDLTGHDVARWVRRFCPDYDAAEVRRMLRKVLKRGIPRRGDEE